jgi:hypothetical protein
MSEKNDSKTIVPSKHLLRSGVTNIVTSVVATAIVAFLGLNGIQSIWATDETDSSSPTTLISTPTTPVVTNQSSTTVQSTTSKSTVPNSQTILKAATFSNILFDSLSSRGSNTFSIVSLSRLALQESTNHENAAQLDISSAQSPAQCSWTEGTLKFIESGKCYLKVTIPALRKSPKFKTFTKTFTITVSEPSLASPERFNPQYRISRLATARGNFLTYGKEVAEELKVGDAKRYWHMRLRMSLQQPSTAPGLARCFRIYVRYSHGKASYNDFTEDIMGCSETTGTSGPKEYCVNFQPSWFTKSSTQQEALVLRDSSGAVTTDDYSIVKYTYIGWGIEWGWDNFNDSTIAGRNWSASEILRAEATDSQPLVNVSEVRSGKC